MSAATLPDWDQLAEGAPTLTATMRRYLEQVGCVLRPASVAAAGVALRTFALFLAESIRTSPRSRSSNGRIWRTTNAGCSTAAPGSGRPPRRPGVCASVRCGCSSSG